MLLCKCLQQKSRREYKQSRTLINVKSADRGSLDDRSLCGTGDVCHLDVISSLFRLSLQHLPTELMQASSADNNTRHTFTSVLANTHIKLLPPPRPPSPAAPHPSLTPPVMKTRCFYPPRTEGSSSAARLRAPTPLLTADAL